MPPATSLEEIGICRPGFDLFWSYWTSHQKINLAGVTNPKSKIFDKTFLENIGYKFDFIKISKVIPEILNENLKFLTSSFSDLSGKANY